jgi:hypothetical protein
LSGEELHCAALASDAEYRLKAALHIRLGSRPGRHADAHRCLSLPDGSAAPAGSVFLDAPDHFSCHFGPAKGHQHLVDHDIIQYVESAFSQRFRELLRVSASSLDQRAQP